MNSDIQEWLRTNRIDPFELPYVAKTTLREWTRYGYIYTPRGWLSNGAGRRSGDLVPDICIEADITHDRGYAVPYFSPITAIDTSGIRLGKIQWDLARFDVMKNYGHTKVGFVQTIVLIIAPTSWSTWRRCRARERTNGIEFILHTNIVPKAHSWDFPDWKVVNATLRAA